MAAAGEMGYAEKVSGNFEIIDGVLNEHDTILENHLQSHDTINEKVQMNTDVLIPNQYAVFGKVVTEYTLSPTSDTISIILPQAVSGTEGYVQILQLPFFQTMSGSLNFRTRSNVTSFTITLLCIDQNMHTLSTVTISPTGAWQKVTIPKNTAGIYARSNRNDVVYMSGYTISMTV